MKLAEKVKNKKKAKVFLIGFLFFLFIFLILDYGTLVLSRVRGSTILVSQLSLYGLLKNHVAVSSEPVPEKWSPVRINEKTYYLESHKTHYYPEAWEKPGRILLLYQYGDFYYLIFGDGVQATVTYWYYQGKDSNVVPHHLSPTGASKYMFGNFWFICLSTVIIACYRCVAISIKKKKCEPADQA